MDRQVLKNRVELNEKQSMEFLFDDERVSVSIFEDKNINKDFEYSQLDKERKLIFYNVVEKRIGSFTTTIQSNGDNLIFNYNIEKVGEKYLLEYFWSGEKKRGVRKKSPFEKFFGSPKNLSIYIASFITILLLVDIIILTFIDKSNYENFWTISTHIITCCLGYLFGNKISETKEEESSNNNLDKEL